ncbi:MAG: 16S rRNA (cytosine(1402)-N(4))-methyltransferase RsmH, partial [Bacteroidales bacterium]|nr:16S rRNA (cytosine(1402)-N(4))-methyltransferase RsmH [Bacteroidales bacterium]
GLAIKPDGKYVDVTFGGGGHSMEILKHLSPKGRLYAFDQDQDGFANIPQDERLVFVHGNFRFLKNFLRYHGVEQIDGLLGDLGVSFHHFDEASRGFSFRFDEGDLDMRMNQKASRKASDIVATYSKEELTRVFKNYGELPQAGRIAALLEKARATQSIQTIAEFKQVLAPIFSREKEKKDMAKVFQALRIEVNGEMQALEAMLQQALEMLAPGGRLSIISYHSLEDRLVKNFMRSGNFEGKVEQDFYGNRLSPFRLVNNKVIVPDKEEETNNPRSRSAKLRIAEKL